MNILDISHFCQNSQVLMVLGLLFFYVFVILHPIIVLLFCWPICDHSSYENSLLKHIMAVLACVASVAHLWVKHSLFELA